MVRYTVAIPLGTAVSFHGIQVVGVGGDWVEKPIQPKGCGRTVNPSIAIGVWLIVSSFYKVGNAVIVGIEVEVVRNPVAIRVIDRI